MVTRVNICQLQWCHPKYAQRNELIWGGFLGGGNSSIFYVHLYLGRIPSLTIIFFRLKPPTRFVEIGVCLDAGEDFWKQMHCEDPEIGILICF